jgi:hypothetical protein
MFNDHNKEDLAKRIYDKLEHNKQTKKAFAYSINIDDNSEVKLKLVASDYDIYDLLESSQVVQEALLSDGFAVITHGWASPVSNEGIPPSENPERKRVRLIAIVDSNKNLVSVVHIKGDDEVLVDESGIGTLADAMRALY